MKHNPTKSDLQNRIGQKRLGVGTILADKPVSN